MVNPYDPQTALTGVGAPRLSIGARSGDPLQYGAGVTAGVARPDGSTSRSAHFPMVSGSGDVNADSKAMLVQAAALMQRALQGGEIKEVNAATHDNSTERAQRYQALVQAQNDRSGQSWQVLGEALGDKVYESMGREGLTRGIMQVKRLGPTETGRLTVRKKDVRAYFMLSNAQTVASQARASFIYPPEFNILAGALIEEGDIERTGGEILDDKYQDLLEQTVKVEDEVMVKLARSASTGYNSTYTFSVMTPSVFATIRNRLASWGAQPSVAVIAFNILTDMTSDSEFAAYFDPFSKLNVIRTGTLTEHGGMRIAVDGYRQPTLRVLADGEVLFFGAPQMLGGITERKPLTPSPVNRYAFMEAKRGWFFHLIEGMTMGVGGRAIARGTRS